MKKIAFILSIIIFSLSLMPCTDGYTCDIDAYGMSVHNDGSDGHNHNDDEGDLCSPFCYCACCSVSFTMNNLNMEIKSNIIPLQEYLFSYNSIHSNEFDDNVWQPPKNC